MQPQTNQSKQRYDRLMQLTLSQQTSYPSFNPGSFTLGRALKKNPKAHFRLPINEGDLFRTCYYEDIEPIGMNIQRRVDPEEIARCIVPTIKAAGSLEEFTQYCVRQSIPPSQQALLDQSKEIEYCFKGISRDALTSDLSRWLPFYCEVCQRYDTWDHPSHMNLMNKSIRKPVDLGSFDLSKQLQHIKIEGEVTCEDRLNCAFHQRSNMIACAYEGQADAHLLDVNDSANRIFKGVQGELEKIRCVIDQSISYCMLRVLLWGTPNRSKGDSKPSCLELYFCIRKILGEAPLDLHVLQKQPIEVELQIIEVGPQSNQSSDLVFIEGPGKPPKYFMSKSNVCDGGGIFTFVPIKRGTLIGSYLGEVLSLSDKSVEQRSRYQQLMNHSSYSFQSKNNVDIDSSFYGNFTRMLNHLPCILANCRFVKNETDVNIVAARDIQPGEQLFVDYGTSYTEPWKEEFDRLIKGLRSIKTRELIGTDDNQPKQQVMEHIANGKTCESTAKDQLLAGEKVLAKASIRTKQPLAVCRKSTVTTMKHIEVIELDIE